MNPIVDPYILLEHPKSQSKHWALVDAFDSVTNGMDNPEALEQIRYLDEPELVGWKWLIFAIKALYEGDAKQVETAVSQIEDTSPPAVLKALFINWLSGHNQGNVIKIDEEELRALYNKLRLPQHPLINRAEQTEEALQQGLLPLFEQYFERILFELYNSSSTDGPALAIRYGVHILCLLHEASYRLEDFLPLLIRSLGEADGCCCLALAFIKLQEHNPALQERTCRIIDACLAAEYGNFADSDMKKTLGLIKRGFSHSERSMQKPRQPREPVQMELF